MIWLTWRQFRVQFLVVAARGRRGRASSSRSTGPGLLDDYHRLTERLHQEPRLRTAQSAAVHRRPGPAVRRSAGDRSVLGRAADRPRTGDRHAPAGVGPEHLAVALARHQGRRHRAGRDRDHRAAQPRGDLVVRPDRRRDQRRPGVRTPTCPGCSRRSSVPAAWCRSGTPPSRSPSGVAVGLVVRRTVVALAVTLAAVILVQILTPTLHPAAPDRADGVLHHRDPGQHPRLHAVRRAERSDSSSRSRWRPGPSAPGSCPTRPSTRPARRSARCPAG